MAALFASGRMIDFILALTVVEAAGVVGWHRLTGRGPTPADLLANLLSGMCLLLALRFALVAAWWGWIALCLLAALVAHLVDLARKARGFAPGPHQGQRPLDPFA